MATKLDRDFVAAAKRCHSEAGGAFDALVLEVERLEGQVDTYERACVAILNTIDSHGKLWGCNRGTPNPSIAPEDAILSAVRGLIDQAARSYRLQSEKDSQCSFCGATATNGKKCECS